MTRQLVMLGYAMDIKLFNIHIILLLETQLRKIGRFNLQKYKEMILTILTGVGVERLMDGLPLKNQVAHSPLGTLDM